MKQIAIPLLMLVFCTSQLHAQEVVYSNLKTSGGSVSFILPVHTQWDDIIPTRGGRLSTLSFIAQNSLLPQPADRIEGLIEFRRFDDPASGPIGTLIGSVPFNRSATLQSRTPYLITLLNLERLRIDLPNERFSVGISMVTSGWGFYVYGPPTIGATTGARWLSEGGVVYDENFGPGSYAWEFSVVPEPGSFWLCSVGLAMLWSARLRRP